MQLEPGARLGSFEIVASLGAGGMGEVYRARDIELGRDVAIKVLPEALASDPERLARFEREAKALAALNHPNIATLHGFERDGETRFLVMELVEGEDLAARLNRGPLPIADALPLFLRIAEGLEAAHAAGIVHRDLKPANVRVSGETADTESVKLVDFGLARAVAPTGSGSVDLSASPTMTAGATLRGEIMGTAPYMSPEQARGIPTDPRTDVWAFGCCLYEALTGARPFQGEDAAQILASVLKDTPDWSALPSDVPPNVAVLLRRCLEKSRRRRLQSIGDARVELEESVTAPENVPPTARTAGSSGSEGSGSAVPWWRWLVRAVALLAALGAGYLLRDWASTADETVRTTYLPIALPDGVQLGYSINPTVAISPNARWIAYRGSGRIYLQDLSAPGPAEALERSEQGHTPFFSPDSTNLAYLSGEEVRVVALTSGETRTVASEVSGVGSGATWSEDGWIYFIDAQGKPLRVAAERGELQGNTKLGVGKFLMHPQAITNDLLLYTVYVPGQPGRIELGSFSTGDATVLVDEGFFARYLPTGHLLVARPDRLLAMTLDLGTLAVGSEIPVLDGVSTDSSENLANYAVSEEGTLLFMTGALEREGWIQRLTTDGRRERLNPEPMDLEYVQISVSPEGDRVAFGRSDFDIWVFDTKRLGIERATSAPGQEWVPLWEPNGERLTFASFQGSDRDWGIRSQSADGLGEMQRLVDDLESQKWPRSWSSDGRFLLYDQISEDTGNDIWMVERGRPDSAQPLLDTEFEEWTPSFSPDGRWIAYGSRESDQGEVYVRSFPDLQTKKKISIGGGVWPKWSADGRLFYQGTGGRVMVVGALDDEGNASEPELFVEGVDGLGSWDILPDGSAVIALEKRPTPELHLVLNWLEELKRLVPVD